MTDEKSSSATFEEAVIKATATAGFELVWEIVGKVGTWTKQKIAVQKAMRQYAETYRERYGNVKVLGMSKPMPLHEIYTAVRVVQPDYLQSFADPDEMEKRFREGRCHDQGEPQDGIDIASQTQFLNILGAPGSGKSTFLRRLGQESLLVNSGEQADERLSTKYCHAKLPVLIELRQFRDGEFDLVKRITNEFSVCGFPESRSFVEAALKSGKLLVLLDGLDEVANDDLATAVSTVGDFVDQYGRADGGNRFVTSCRTAQYKNYFKKFSDVVLADFSDEQVEKFAEAWFSSLKATQHDVAAEFLKQLRNPGNAGALELARTPLLLTFLCMTFEKGQELPPNPALLYERALDILLREWAADKFVHNDPIAEGLHARLELDMLSEMAATLFAKNQFFFTRDEAVAAIELFMRNELNAPKTVDPDAVLRAIEEQQGLIVRRSMNHYSFSHLTIQEYLSARYHSSETAMVRLVDEHLADVRWRVVFELMAGLGRADRMLLHMAERYVAIRRGDEPSCPVCGLDGDYREAFTHRKSVPAYQERQGGSRLFPNGLFIPVETIIAWSTGARSAGEPNHRAANGSMSAAAITIHRCSMAAYSLSPDAWNEVCEKILGPAPDQENK